MDNPSAEWTKCCLETLASRWRDGAKIEKLTCRTCRRTRFKETCEYFLSGCCIFHDLVSMKVQLIAIIIAQVSIVVTVIGFLLAQISVLVTVKHEAEAGETSLEKKRHISLGDSDDDILLFIQITDLHLSIFDNMERFHQLKEFCTVNLPAIKPKVVLATGDLTDAKTADNMGSRQFEAEWKMYQEVLSTCGAMKTVQWLDLKGNHDNFNMHGHNSSKNYFRQFSAQGRLRAPGSYMVSVQSSEYTKYAFVAVDATLDVGPKRILNFVGYLDDAKMAKLEQLQWKAEHQLKVNASIWFGHYPSSSIVSAAPGLRQIASRSLAYLCGHFHSFYGIVPQMYTKHHSGLMELELADWKQSRTYRVGVLDQGIFSFADVVHNVWPVIIVTNPKPAILTEAGGEPLDLIMKSTYIRLLLFSPASITQCQVKIDDGPWRQCQLRGLNHPLYTVAWEPKKYAKGLHTIHVRARDRSGSLNQISHEFSLDGSRPLFPFLARLALMIDITTAAQVLFGLGITACVVPLCMARLVHQAVLHRKVEMHRFHNRFVRSWLRKLWIMANIDCLCYPFIFYTLYLVVGPWWIGELIDGSTAYVFAWGVIFEDDSKFMPGTMTYFYGFIHLLVFNAPLIPVLGYTADLRFMTCSSRGQSAVKNTLARQYVKHLPFLLFVVVHVALCIPFWIGNGTMAFLLSPQRTWGLILAVYLWSRANRLDSSHFLSILKVWK